jgi:hypothetical protein
MVQGLVKKVKDAWRKGKVATLLLRDVKGAFLSTMISCVDGGGAERPHGKRWVIFGSWDLM